MTEEMGVIIDVTSTVCDIQLALWDTLIYYKTRTLAANWKDIFPEQTEVDLKVSHFLHLSLHQNCDSDISAVLLTCCKKIQAIMWSDTALSQTIHNGYVQFPLVRLQTEQEQSAIYFIKLVSLVK